METHKPNVHKHNIIETNIGNEIQRRADQLLVGCQINITLFHEDEFATLLQSYEIQQEQDGIISANILSEETGTTAVIAKNENGDESLTIALLADRDLGLLTFEATKALIWYAYFMQIEETTEDQLSCLVHNEQACELALMNIDQVVKNKLETLTTYLIGVFELSESTDTQQSGKEEVTPN